MPPPDESISNYESILLNSFEEDFDENTNIAVNGGTDELNAGVNYFVDEEGRYYYRKDIQNLVSLPIEQELQNNGEEAPIIVEGDSYQTVTLMPSNSVEDEISYVLVVQNEIEPPINIDPNVNQIEENVNHVYIVQKEAESIDKEADNFEESSQYTIVSEENTQTRSHFACKFCSYTNNKRYLLLRHLKTHSANRPHKCILCDRGFKTIKALQNHVNMHNGVKPHPCKQCKTSFTTSGELVRHMRYRHTHEKPHKCTECDYASVELSKLKRHVRSHTGERPYQCPDCTYASPDMFKLKCHRRTHTGEKPYKCEFCKGSFSQYNSLKLHKMIHEESEKPVFSCELCPTKCSRKTDLRIHMQRLHSSEKPHQSNRCGKKFPDKYTCKIHNKTHMGEKSYKCEVCSYASTTLKNLQSHKFKHKNEKPYNCDQCDHSFEQKDLLHHHESLCHNPNYEPTEKSHTCNDCSRMFADKGDLIRHLAIHDPESGQQERELTLLADNINTVNSLETVEIIELNLKSDQGGEVMTVADDNGQQYLVLGVIQAPNDPDQQINIIPPEEFLNKKGTEQEEINKEESEKIQLNNVNKTVENDIDTCFDFVKDYEPGQSDVVEMMTLY